jgi:hypothetical protein
MINSESDFIDELITVIEMEYGEEVARIVKLKESLGAYHMTIIFKDYCLLEAKIKVCEFCDMPSVRIQGNYY